mmetsp:Transcript_2334/g.15587  ORF Transcript_2334/g.15587 Transcript_2334/m.15587 type:complete len:180 (-) Transcript_2334:805-1344(-)
MLMSNQAGICAPILIVTGRVFAVGNTHLIHGMSNTRGTSAHPFPVSPRPWSMMTVALVLVLAPTTTGEGNRDIVFAKNQAVDVDPRTVSARARRSNHTSLRLPSTCTCFDAPEAPTFAIRSWERSDVALGDVLDVAPTVGCVTTKPHVERLRASDEETFCFTLRRIAPTSKLVREVRLR